MGDGDDPIDFRDNKESTSSIHPRRRDEKKSAIAADAWASLLPDLLLDIFRRLESTAVIRCAGACKPWRRAIISNASSLRPCPDRFNPNLLIGFFHYSWDDAAVDARSPRPRPMISVTAVDSGHCEKLSSLIPPASAGGVDLSSSQLILSSRDGWVLLLLRHGQYQYELCLCNPVARHCTFLPPPSIMKDELDFTLLSGYDLSSPDTRDEHRSVRILAKTGTHKLCTEEDRLIYQVFSCGGDGVGIWGPVQRSEKVDKGLQMVMYGRLGDSAVVARDAVYWLAGPKLSGGQITCTVGLDICTGRAWATKLPSQCEFIDTSTTPYVLTTSGNGGLSLLEPLPDHHRHIQVWVLDGDRDAVEWTVQHKISIHVPNHPADDNPGFLSSTLVCPRSGFLLNVLSSGRQQLINLDSRASQPVQHIDKRRRYRTDYYPYEMDWSTYISNMKNFVSTGTTATASLEGSVWLMSPKPIIATLLKLNMGCRVEECETVGPTNGFVGRSGHES